MAERYFTFEELQQAAQNNPAVADALKQHARELKEQIDNGSHARVDEKNGVILFHNNGRENRSWGAKRNESGEPKYDATYADVMVEHYQQMADKRGVVVGAIDDQMLSNFATWLRNQNGKEGAPTLEAIKQEIASKENAGSAPARPQEAVHFGADHSRIASMLFNNGFISGMDGRQVVQNPVSGEALTEFKKHVLGNDKLVLEPDVLKASLLAYANNIAQSEEQANVAARKAANVPVDAAAAKTPDPAEQIPSTMVNVPGGKAMPGAAAPQNGLKKADAPEADKLKQQPNLIKETEGYKKGMESYEKSQRDNAKKRMKPAGNEPLTIEHVERMMSGALQDAAYGTPLSKTSKVVAALEALIKEEAGDVDGAGKEALKARLLLKGFDAGFEELSKSRPPGQPITLSDEAKKHIKEAIKQELHGDSQAQTKEKEQAAAQEQVAQQAAPQKERKGLLERIIGVVQEAYAYVVSNPAEGLQELAGLKDGPSAFVQVAGAGKENDRADYAAIMRGNNEFHKGLHASIGGIQKAFDPQQGHHASPGQSAMQQKGEIAVEPAAPSRQLHT